MRIAALYDIHGNLPALEAVLEEVRAAAVDRVVVGGDVFPGPMANEALALLLDLDLPVEFLMGNGDRQVLELAASAAANRIPAADRISAAERIPEAYRESMRWVAEGLRPEHRRVIAAWPASVRRAVEGLGEVLFCHATPRSDTEIFTRATPEDRLREIFEAPGVPLVVCGHTHMPFDRTIGRVRVVNAGSVGMPFGEPGAYWLLLGPEVQVRRTSYDLDAAAARIRATRYPQAQEFAAQNVLEPPSEQEMLEVLTRAELR